MSITIKDIAKMANVSIATVSRVINNKAEGIRQDTRERILSIIKEYEYQPNTIARSMITKKTSTIGLVIPDIRNPFFPELVRGVEDFCKTKKYSVFLCNTDGDQKREKEYLNLLKEKNVDGIIYTYAYVGASKRLEDFIDKSKIPIVLLDRGDVANSFSGVYIDNKKAGYLATEHLIGLSHKKIGCITGPDFVQNSQDRLTGYMKALVDNGITVNKQWIKLGNYQLEGGYAAAKKLLTEQEVTAIFAFNDLMAFGVYQAAYELGVRIPEELSIVGFDNIKYNQLLTPKLTTIEQPTYEMGKIAADLLFNQIRIGSKVETKTMYLEPKLIVKESTSLAVIK